MKFPKDWPPVGQDSAALCFCHWVLTGAWHRVSICCGWNEELEVVLHLSGSRLWVKFQHHPVNTAGKSDLEIPVYPTYKTAESKEFINLCSSFRASPVYIYIYQLVPLNESNHKLTQQLCVALKCSVAHFKLAYQQETLIFTNANILLLATLI